MAFTEDSNGSTNYLLKSKRFVSPFLTAICRRKLLITISFSLCIYFAIYAWYTNNEAENGLPNRSLMQRLAPYLPLNVDKNTFIPEDQQDVDEYDLIVSSNKDASSSLNSPDDFLIKKGITTTKTHLKMHKTLPNENNSTGSITHSEESNDESLKRVGVDFAKANKSKSTKPDKSLLLNLNGCKIPKFDPWDPSIKHLIHLQEPYVCAGPPLLMKSNLNGSVSINESVLLFHHGLRPHHISCFYQAIHREHEVPNYPFEYSYSSGNVTELEFGVPLNEEFVSAYCDLSGIKYYQYFAFPHLKPEVEEERETRSPPEHRLNIILAGIDSVSKLNFLRHFSRTRSFLKRKLRPFSMKGYNKVGDNTFPNLVPMLTGHFVEHYYNESMQYTYVFDDVDLIWKDYAKRGYRTFYAEDSPYIGTFNYLKRGFYDPPTDYYLRTILLAMENAPNKKHNPPLCDNSILDTDFIYDYLRDFVSIMDKRPYIAFAMVSKITHDLLNYASYADEPAVRLLEDLWNSGTLNNSALVLFSDHGIRYGEIRQTYIGKFEEKMPFMYVYFPEWFLEQHPDMAKALETNQERLVTLFDIHATMIHLLDLDQDMATPEMRSVTLGSSLLQEISPNRTCEEANIKEHFCPCQSYKVPVDDPKVTEAAQAIVDDINKQLLPFNGSCAILELDRILDARLNHAEPQLDIFQTFYQPHTDYMVTLVTKPGEAVFDGTVRHDLFSTSFTVLGISRINMYRDQSKCIDSQKMKIFCFCNS